MSKVLVEVDTNDKSIVVKVDGDIIKNVIEVFGFVEDNGFRFSVMTSEKVGDINKITKFIAIGTEEANMAEITGSIIDYDSISGFVGVCDFKTRAQNDIHTFFGV